MGLWIHVFCRSSDALSLGEVMDFIQDGVFFDDAPEIRGDNERGATSWAIDVIYDAQIRPVQISFGEADETTSATIEELLEEHSPAEPALAERLRQTRQELVLHFSSDISDDCWAMLDCLEAFVARKLDGVVYASEGIYDQELQPLWRFER